jgi:formylglycine-generating enzyme required for sulfatase activity
MELVLVRAGEFMMGAPADEGGYDEDEGPQHRVTIGKPFYMGKHEVTEAEWVAVTGTFPSTSRAGADYPVKNTSWDDATEFCRKLSRKVGREIRLPTEAEWEYACRAGTRTTYGFGDSAEQLGDYAWFGTNSGGKIHPVGARKPNAWGLYDMHGNVWEWCQDWYDRYPGSTAAREDFGQRLRMMRGGSWVTDLEMCRAAFRGAGVPDDRYTDDRGVRVATDAGERQ